MLQDSNGTRLYRKVTVRVVFPDAIFPPKLMVQHAGPRQGFNPDGINEILMGIAEQLDTLYPWWDFHGLELTPEGRTARYIFKFAGYRSTKITPNDERTTLGPETPEDTTTGAIKAAVGTTLQELASQD